MAVTIRDDAAMSQGNEPFKRDERGQPSFEVTIDGRVMQAYEGQTLLSVAIENGIMDIPNLCNDDKLEPTSACRMCLVEINGADRPLPSCNTAALPGMVVRTASDRLKSIRRTNLEMMLSDHNAYCQPPCQVGCPTHIDIPGYLELIAQGAEPRGGAPGEGSAAVPLHPRPDLPGALPGSLSPWAGGGRDRHLPHARVRRRAVHRRPADALGARGRPPARRSRWWARGRVASPPPTTSR